MVRAGDIRQFILGGREFDPATDSKWTIMGGGRENEASMTGNGSLHVTQTRKTAGIKGCSVSIDDARGDYQFLLEKKNAGLPVPCTITTASGETRSGSLVIVGELEYNTGEGTCGFDLNGIKFDKI